MGINQCFSIWGGFTPVDICRHLETSLVVVTGGHATDTWRVEARDAATHRPLHRAAPTTTNFPAQMSIVFIYVKIQQLTFDRFILLYV